MCAAMARRHGTEFMLLPSDEPGIRSEYNPSHNSADTTPEMSATGRQMSEAGRGSGRAYLEQIVSSMPNMFSGVMPMLIDGGVDEGWKDFVCGTCINYDKEKSVCTFRNLRVEANQIFCDFYDPLPEDDDECE